MSTVSQSPAAGDRPLSGAAPRGLSSRALWDWIGAASLAALLACFSVAEQFIVIGSKEGGWSYGYVRGFGADVLTAAGAAMALFAALLFFIRQLTRREWLLVIASLAVGSGAQAIIRTVAPFTLESIFVSDTATAFYSVTRQFSPAAVLQDFDRLRPAWPLHAQSNMPGKLMLVYALETMTRSPAALAGLVILVSNLGAVLMYLFVRRLFADRRMALYAAALYLVLPAKLYFFPILNTVTPVVVLACAVLLLEWLRTGSAIVAAALGLCLFVLTFFEPLPLIMGLPFALLVIRAASLRQTTWPRVASHVAVGLAAAAAAYACMKFLTGFDLIRTFRQLGQEAAEFNTVANRPYSVWVIANLREFLFGMGVCQAILFPAALVDGIRRGRTWRDAASQPMVVFAIGILLVLIVIDAIGLNRGEVTRLWIFLACFFQVPAAYICSRLESRLALAAVGAVTVLQGTIGLAMIGFVGP